MPYQSTITFTLDVICPWTYLAYRRLLEALSQYRTSHPSSSAEFSFKFTPYQLYPTTSKEGVDKYAWYRDEKYAGSEEKMQMYAKYMDQLGNAEGITFDWHGLMANSFDALRVLVYFQTEKGGEAAHRVLQSLYQQYFTMKRSPADEEMLKTVCEAAGLSQEEAEILVKDKSMGQAETEEMIRENRGNGVDSVPHMVFEGRKRDFTLVGAKEVGEYVKVLESVAKECG